jgi:hypothetical protein
MKRLSWVDLDASLLSRQRDSQTTTSCAYCGSFLEASVDLALGCSTIGTHQEAALKRSALGLLYAMGQWLGLAKRWGLHLQCDSNLLLQVRLV